MASLDMSLDDMIKSRKNSERNRGQGSSRGSRRGRGPGGSSSRGGRAYGAPRRGPFGLSTRPSAQMIAKARLKLWMSYALHRQICYALCTLHEDFCFGLEIQI